MTAEECYDTIGQEVSLSFIFTGGGTSKKVQQKIKLNVISDWQKDKDRIELLETNLSRILGEVKSLYTSVANINNETNE